MKTTDLNPNEFNPYFKLYIDLVPPLELLDALEHSRNRINDILKKIPISKIDYRYAEGKWTIKEVILHLIDTERIFSTRALRIARKDKTNLPGYDENIFVDNMNTKKRSILNIALEYNTVKDSSIALFKSLTKEDLSQIGQVNNHSMSARAVAFILAGHDLHHAKVIEERYF